MTGKNGPPLALGVVERWCAKVEGAYSHRLNEVLLRSPEEGRVMLLSFLTHLKGRFINGIRERLLFWKTAPHMICGLAGTYWGYSIGDCVRIADKLQALWDSTID